MNQGIAVVTGASRGLGRGIARALGSRGLTVYVTGRRGDELDKAAGEVTAAGGRGVAATCDHHSDEQVKALFARVRADSGRLDILVNNAAAVYPRDLSTPGTFWQLIGAELGMRYGIKDLDGKQPLTYRESMGNPGGRFFVPAARTP